MSELLIRQFLFASLRGGLAAKAKELGYEMTAGEAWRSPEQAAINAMGPDAWKRLATVLESYPEFHALAVAMMAKAATRAGVGILHSVHCDRLADDGNLFKDGSYIEDKGPYAELGAWWKAQHPLCRWGGDFRDYDHWSIEAPDGRK